MGELSLPLTSGFLLSPESVSVLDGSDSLIGWKEINAKLTMKGKAPVDVGGSRVSGGWVPGIPVWTATIKFDLTWWSEYLLKHPGGYMDQVLNRTFAYLSLAREFSLQLKGMTMLDQDTTATKGGDGGLEMATSWGMLDVKHTVDGQEIRYIAEGLL